MINQPERSTAANDGALAELVDHLIERLQQGETIELEDILIEHSQHATQIRAVWPSLEMIGQLKSADTAGRADTDLSSNDWSEQQHLGDFRILREIGRGGMGVVYEAEQRSLGRSVALKVLPFAARLDSRSMKRFINEARAAARLQHQNIVPVISVGEAGGLHYYAMQYVDGPTLAVVIRELKRLRIPDDVEFDVSNNRKAATQLGLASDMAFELASGRFTVRRELGSEDKVTNPTREECDESVAESDNRSDALRKSRSDSAVRNTAPIAGLTTEASANGKDYFRSVAELGIQAAVGLAHAHKHGVVHRDIKPDNLLIDQSGNLWITDFGLARVMDGPPITMTGDLLGTLRFMSPEQILGKRAKVDHRTDVYSLGLTLYELLTLRPAFEAEDRADVLRRIVNEEPRSPRRCKRSIPKELETIVIKAIEKSPDERYLTAQALADDLQRYLVGKPVRAKPINLIKRSIK